jgi:ketosteroid isomerase-like protein
MGNSQNVELVRQAYEAFARADIPGVLATLSQDVDWLIHGPERIIPFVGRRRGPGQVADFFRKLADSQIAELFQPLEFIDGQDKVIVLGTQRWRVKSTNRVYSDDWVHVFTVANGKITKFQEYHDTFAEAAAHADVPGA